MEFNPLFLLVSCQKEQHKWKRLSHIFTKYEHCILCGGLSDSNYLIHKNLLLLNCNDKYEGLPEKILGALLVISRDEKYKKISHVIKIDSDNKFQSLSLILKKIKSFNSYDYFGARLNKIYGSQKGNTKWHFGKVSEDSFWHENEYKGEYCDWIDGGCSYCLSRRAIELLTSDFDFSNFKKISKNHIYEDLMIAILLKKYNIYPKNVSYGIEGDK